MEELRLDSEALRDIAKTIYDYCNSQIALLDDYYSQIMALQYDWNDDQTFGSMINEINDLKNKAKESIWNIQSKYPNIFLEKALEIEARPVFTPQVGGYVASGSSASYGSHGTGSSSYHSVSTAAPSVRFPLSKSNRESFKNGKYEICVLDKPMTAYRYFGAPQGQSINSISSPEISSAQLQQYLEQKNTGGGSRLTGGYFSTRGDLSAEEVKELLALNPEWGNTAVFVAEFEIPAGTEIAVGVVEYQNSKKQNVIKFGGEKQIFVTESGHRNMANKMQGWYKSLKETGVNKEEKSKEETESNG